jgi:hypothetical protein
MEGPEPFEFRQAISVLKSTGMKAASARELRDGISIISAECLYHHTYQYFLKGHMLEYTNDFAQWAGESLEESVLAEQLSNIDPYRHRNMQDLRLELLGVFDFYLARFPEPRSALPGSEFYFNEAVTLVFHEGVRARNLAEFLIAIRFVDPRSIYFHFYEARSRTGSGVDDFSTWIEESIRKPNLAQTIRRIDPFMLSIEGIRDRIVEVVDMELKHDMENL